MSIERVYAITSLTAHQATAADLAIGVLRRAEWDNAAEGLRHTAGT